MPIYTNIDITEALPFRAQKAGPRGGRHLMNHSFDLNEHLVNAVQHSNDAIMTKTLDGTVLTWNPAAERMFGYAASEMVGQKLLKILPSDRVHEEDFILSQVAAGQRVDHFRTQRRRKDGQLIDISVTISPIRDAQGQVVAASGIARDITAQLQAERQIAQYKALIDSSEDAIVSKDRSGIICTWNLGATRIFGYTADEAIGRHIAMLFPPERLHEEAKLLQTLLSGDVVKHFRTTRLTRDERRIFVSVSLSAIRDEHGDVIGFSKIVRDLTQEIAQEQQLWQDVHFDGLTGLMSRNGLQSTVDELIRIPLMRQRSMALVYLRVEDANTAPRDQAPRVADEFRMQVAQALRGAARQADEIARLQGNRYGILVQDFTHLSVVTTVAEKLRASVEALRDVQGRSVSPQVQVGLAVYPEDGRSFNSLLKHAEHQAFNTADSGTSVAPAPSFHRRDGLDLPDDFFLVQALNKALDLQQVFVLYQPIVDARTGRTVKAEALLRWRHPELGLIPPNVFVPLAERYGLISPLSQWVLRQSLQNLARWTELFDMNFQVSVNRSAHDFTDVGENVNEMRDALHEFGLCGGNLILELTEYSLVSSPQAAERILQGFRALGIGIAIDDFGTGYSSLSYLKLYPVDFLKIDKSFVDHLGEGAVDNLLCEGIVQIGHRLGLQIVAEGVETAQQAALLQAMGAEFLQGYHYDRPLDAAALEARLYAETRAGAAGPGTAKSG